MKQFFLFASLIFGSLAAQAQSIEALRDSMAADNLNYQVELAIRYLSGDGVELDVEKGVSLIRDAADKGNRFGELWMGLCYKEGYGVETDYDEAFRWFMSSAQKGNVGAMGMLGEAYKYGQGTEVDLTKANYTTSRALSEVTLIPNTLWASITWLEMAFKGIGKRVLTCSSSLLNRVFLMPLTCCRCATSTAGAPRKTKIKPSSAWRSSSKGKMSQLYKRLMKP